MSLAGLNSHQWYRSSPSSLLLCNVSISPFPYRIYQGKQQYSLGSISMGRQMQIEPPVSIKDLRLVTWVSHSRWNVSNAGWQHSSLHTSIFYLNIQYTGKDYLKPLFTGTTNQYWRNVFVWRETLTPPSSLQNLQGLKHRVWRDTPTTTGIYRSCFSKYYLCLSLPSIQSLPSVVSRSWLSDFISSSLVLTLSASLTCCDWLSYFCMTLPFSNKRFGNNSYRRTHIKHWLDAY